MAYHETCGDVQRGEVMMQIGMGGGMKVGTQGKMCSCCAAELLRYPWWMH